MTRTRPPSRRGAAPSAAPRARPRAPLVLGVLASGSAAAGSLSFLDPRGPVAEAQRAHLFEVLGLLSIVVVPVLVLTPLVAWRYRYSNPKAEYRPTWTFSGRLEVLVWGVPVLVVAALATLLVRSTLALDPYAPIASGLPGEGPVPAGAPLPVQVVGTDWKWLFVYPEEGVATLGELAFPTDRQLALELTSLTAVQSFFVPALGSQIYAMGGMANRLHLAADAPGEFLGENTQYNGEGFAAQKFVARALAPDDYAAWVGRVRGTGAPLDARALAIVTGRNTVADVRRRLPAAGDASGAVYFDEVPDALFERLMARSRRARTDRADGPPPGAGAGGAGR